MSEPKTFTCERCGGTFTSVSSDGEAMAEARANGFTESEEELAVICDDCYQLFTARMGSRVFVDQKIWAISCDPPIVDLVLGGVEAPWWRRLFGWIQRTV